MKNNTQIREEQDKQLDQTLALTEKILNIAIEQGRQIDEENAKRGIGVQPKQQQNTMIQSQQQQQQQQQPNVAVQRNIFQSALHQIANGLHYIYEALINMNKESIQNIDTAQDLEKGKSQQR